jgi:hypothetical protein
MNAALGVLLDILGALALAVAGIAVPLGLLLSIGGAG